MNEKIIITEEYLERLSAIARFVRETRRMENYSQVELGNDCGLHRKTIENIESGSRNYSVVSLLKVMMGLGFDPFESDEY
jgi:transcriptional regulator with XRE-family HTH domain